MRSREVVRAVRRTARRTWRSNRPAVLGIRERLTDPSVALTFDDGPDPRFTPEVLDVLAELAVPATFFVVGDSARRHPEIVRRILAEGHRVGTHGGTHRDLWEATARTLAEDIRRGKHDLEDVIGARVDLYRPAKGHVDLRVGLLARRHRLRLWLWTVDPKDWRPDATTDEIVAVGAAAGPGDVVLLHDGLHQPEAPQALDRTATVEALRGIVHAVHARGTDFVPLP